MIAVAPILLLLLLFCGCAGEQPDASGADAALQEQTNLLLAIPQPRADLTPSAEVERSALSMAVYEVNPQSFAISSAVTTGEYFGIEYALFEPSQDGLAWAVYSVEMPVGEKLDEVIVDVDNADLGDEEWLPELPWWVGIADCTAQRWIWHGPFTEEYAQVDVDNDAPRERFVNSQGAVVWVVASHCPPSSAPAGMCVWAMDFGTEY